MSTFELLGHDCAVGRYPAPVVPVGRLEDGRLVVAYWAETGATFIPVDCTAKYEEHSLELRARLGAFDPNTEHLFAHSASDVEKYAQVNEKAFFQQLLRQDGFSRENPFMRLTLAEVTKDITSILPEMKRCLLALPADNPRLRELWYEKQRGELEKEIPGIAAELPHAWHEFVGLTKDKVYHLSTFRSEAPEKARLVKELFCSREQELKRALAILRQNLDDGGRRSELNDKHPWVIHGDSRSGKSHMARRLMLELPDSSSRIQIKLIVREDLDAATAMRKLFDELLQICCRETSPILPVGASRLLDLGSSAGGQPSAGLIARACGQIVRMLVESANVEHVLILFDDVDLLESYADRERNGRAQRAALSSAIAELVKTPCVDVILTARSWYAETRRECEELARLDPMTEDELIAVHDLQLSVFAPSRPCDFLSREAVRSAANGADGLPGVFLEILRIALSAYKEDSDWGTRDTTWYLFTQVKEFGRRGMLVPDARSVLESAVNAGQRTLNVEDRNVLLHTPFQNVYAIQSYYSETTWSVPSVVKEAISISLRPEEDRDERSGA